MTTQRKYISGSQLLRKVYVHHSGQQNGISRSRNRSADPGTDQLTGDRIRLQMQCTESNCQRQVTCDRKAALLQVCSCLLPFDKLQSTCIFQTHDCTAPNREVSNTLSLSFTSWFDFLCTQQLSDICVFKLFLFCGTHILTLLVH